MCTGYTVIPHTVLIPLANALVSHRLDYCNSLIGITTGNLNKQQTDKNYCHTKTA